MDSFCERAPEALPRQLRERCLDIRFIKRLLPAGAAGKTAPTPDVQMSASSRRALCVEP